MTHNHILSRIEESKSKKVTRDAFLYLNPKGDKEKFAQCATCVMWTGPEHNTCSIMGKTKVLGTDSCGYYVNGEPNSGLAGKEEARVTLEEAGLVHREVRCENCGAFDTKRSVCLAFEEINKAMPDNFDLDTKVDSYGCCNAQHPK